MKKIYILLIVILALALSTLACALGKGCPKDGKGAFFDRKIHMTMTQMVGVTDSMPRNVLAGQTRWNLRPNVEQEWCGGFWAGCLWYDYALTGQSDVLRAATETACSMEYLMIRPVFDHDLGFLTITSMLNGYRFSPDEQAREEFRRVLLICADSLATLYNPQVGTMLSWPRHVGDYGGHNTIMDNMINLELLFWASEQTGNPAYAAMARSHADTTMAYHFREDATCYHVAVYDPVTGKHLYNCTHQGLNDSSVWARGQAWAIYGYTMVYRYTHDEKYLRFAQRVTDAYLSRLPEDGVPYWDFCDPRIPNAPRDASAGAIVASALYELSGYVSGEDRARYRAAADHTMHSFRTDYLAPEDSPAILAHSTGHHPAGSEIDASIIYADYYYLEALYRQSHN